MAKDRNSERPVRAHTIDRRAAAAEKAGAPGARPLKAQHLERGDRNIWPGKKPTGSTVTK
jgi:hypothetical protein